MIKERNFICSEIGKQFLLDNDSNVIMLKGAVGSGKSTLCCMKIMLLAQNMPPGFDGIRRCKVGVVRNTYSQLKTTTIRTWLDWFPEEYFGCISGDSPAIHKITEPGLELELVFLAIENSRDIVRLKSFEFTAIYVNEAQFFHNREILQTFIERTDRYPNPNTVGGDLGKKLVIMDCNPPSNTHWIYEIFEKERPEGFKLYNMPPALVKDEDGNWINNPNADYLWQLAKEGEEPRYWLDLTKGATEEYIRVSLCGEYGILEEGRAVHPEYNDRIHYAGRPMQANDQVELGLGFDFGLTPACSIVQLLPTGQLVVLDELWCDDMAIREFAESIVIPHLDRNYSFWRKNYKSKHDPAGSQRAQTDAKSCADILRELGIISMPAASNAAEFRRDAAKYFLQRMAGGQPGLLLSDKCQRLREGLMGKYKFELIKSSSMSDERRFQEKPLKNKYSHICEAFEYICTEYARVSKQPAANTHVKPFIMYRGNFMGR